MSDTLLKNNLVNPICLLRCFGNRQSLKSRQNDRLSQAFEPRVSPEHPQETKAKRSPVGKFDKMTWDKDALKLEVESYEDGTFVNWSNLAKKYNVTNTKGEIAENGSQIVKEWLKFVGADTERFKRYHINSDSPRIRRKKRRGLGGEISIPTPETNASLKKQLEEKILQNEFSVGKLIVPRKVQYHSCTVSMFFVFHRQQIHRH